MKTTIRKRRRCIMILVMLLFLSCALMSAPMTALAHGPSKVVLAYDKASKTLSVTITHRVSDPKSHYISKVTIMSNDMVMKTHPSQDWNKEPANVVSEDRVIQTHTYKGQPSADTFTYTYTVEAVAGTKLTAEAECNYFGSDKGSVTVP